MRVPVHGGGWNIWLMSADGTDAHRITYDHRFDDALAWSATGHKLAYTSHLLDDRDWQIRLVGVSGPAERVLYTCSAPCRGGTPNLALSPSGRQIAFTIAVGSKPQAIPRIAIVHAAGGHMHFPPVRPGACCLSWPTSTDRGP